MMYLHSLKYTFFTLIRDKSQVFWCFAFPLLLGTMFSFAFGNLGASETFAAIPIAVVMEEATDSDNLEDVALLESMDSSVYAEMPIEVMENINFSNSIRELLDTLSEPGEGQFLEVSYTTEKEALDLLEKKEIYGIITVDAPSVADFANAMSSTEISITPLRLAISSEMNSDPLYQSILSVFVEQFNLQYRTVSDIVMNDPTKMESMFDLVAVETSYLKEESLGAETLDECLTYFFNLISMTCLFAAMAGSNIAIDNQANLSTLGARKSLSPVHKLISTLGELTALLIFEFMTVVIALVYFTTILGIDFGNRIGYIALTALIGCLAGISIGFFIGTIGRFNKDTKFGILMAVIMIGCFLSGLMIGNMRVIVEEICPLINRINPSALISDALYSLVIYPSLDRYYTNILSLLAISAVLCLGGFAMMRRKKYASL